VRLERLRLVNFRRFSDAEIEFPDGLIGIVGRNGAGKSSLIESILWALFGHEAARTNKELVKRQAAAPGEDVVVRLQFEIEGIAHTITRRLRGRSMQPEASVESGGTLVVAPGPNSWEQANLLITRILGFDRSSFESTVVAKQGELAALSELRPAQRKRVLLGLLGIDRIDQAVQHARADGRILDARLTEARRSLVDEESLRAELKKTEEELAAATTAFTLAQAEADTSRRRLGSAQALADELLGRKLKDQELRVRLQASQSRLETVWGQRTRLGAEVHLARERIAQGSELRSRLDRLSDVDERILALDRARHLLAQRQSLLEKQDTIRRGVERVSDAPPEAQAPTEPDLRASLAGFQKELDALATQQGRLEAEKGDLAARLAEARPKSLDHSPEWAADDCCPTCGRELADAADRLRHQFQETLTAWEQSRELLQARLAQCVQDLQRLQDRRRTANEGRRLAEAALRQHQEQATVAAVERARAERMRSDLLEIEAALATVPETPFDPAEQERLVVARAERDRLREAITRIEESERRLARMQDEDRLLSAQEQEIIRERESASRELRSASYETGSWEKAHAESEALRRRVETAERDVIQWRERAEASTRQRARLAGSLAKLEDRRKELKELEEGLRLLDVLAARRGEEGVLPEFRTHLIGRLRPALSRAAGQLLGQMTQGRYADLMLDDEYGASLYDGGVAHPLERFSGGEVDVCNLALRLAVSELVSNARGRSRLQFVALDEVLGSQDEERRGAILIALNSLANVFRQVFVITHTEDVRERLEHVLRVVDAGDGTSRFVATWTDPERDAPRPPPREPDPPSPLVVTARA
jgi:DNA repair protein SbcC/Rad50